MSWGCSDVSVIGFSSVWVSDVDKLCGVYGV